MRESTDNRWSAAAGRRRSGRRAADNHFYDTRPPLLFATGLAAGAIVWLHSVAFFGTGQSLASSAPYVILDTLLAIPLAGAALWTAARLAPGVPGLRRGLLAAVAFSALLVPLVLAQPVTHAVVGEAGALPGAGGAASVLIAWPAVLVAALVGVATHRLVIDRRARRRLVARVRASRRPLVVTGSGLALVAGIGAAAMLPASPALAQAGSCANAPQRVYDVTAINVTITVNRFGDNDPWGFMYVLDDNLAAVRAEEARLANASATGQVVEDGEVANPDTNWPALVEDDPEAQVVSSGLSGQDLIQPLVLRARLGECVVINFTNDLTQGPVSGPRNNNMFAFPGDTPDVSIDMQGVTYDAAGGAGGQEAGNNSPSMTAPGGAQQYRFFLDPLLGEGAKLFRSGGESTQLTAHGLFGALIAEPAGARWFDPSSGADRTDDTGWSNWEAMIQSPSQPTFREFTILYHEIGDEDFNVRRPLREPGVDTDPFDPNRQVGGPMPMVDAGPPNVDAPFNSGTSTGMYRPGSRAINYRAESFYRRLQLETQRVVEEDPTPTNDEAADAQKDNKALTYSSYTYGDPATPVARSYLGEPTKTRLAHVGFEQLHIHHLHGGATRWRQNPGADDTAIDSGLDKEPIQDAQSIRLDSQTISPSESFSLEHECGAGGCQQAAGDFLYHCHIAHHYFAGMWGIWRVFDAAQEGLAPLPEADAPPAAVTSAELIGTTLDNGVAVVADGDVTDPDNQIGITELAESQLPPAGQRFDQQDATVWDWIRTGPDDAPLFLGEPLDGRVWANYVAENPGQRPPILFNPRNGRPAYPVLSPQVTERPPFAGNEHTGAPYLGNNVTEDRPDGVCLNAPGTEIREYDITAVSVDIPMTNRETDTGGMLFVLNENKNALLAGDMPTEPLVIRSNVGDCVDITLGNEIDNAEREDLGHDVLAKTNMHTHFVQFDPQGSDGVITGFNYEQSIFPAQFEDRSLTSGVSAGTSTVNVNHVDRLRPGIGISIGVGTPDIEIRTIAALDEAAGTITFDRALDNSHAAGDWVTTEFVQYRWYSDVDSGTIFWHDHVDGIISWAHGLFAAHIIEPPGSSYHDPVTGEEVRSGAVVDIRNTQGGSVGVGQSGSFREFMLFLHNGRPDASDVGLNPGQECEEGTINLRAEPLGERVPFDPALAAGPDDAQNVDPAATDQRFEFNGDLRCRNAYVRDLGGGAGPNDGTAVATVTTVDPHAFSSVTYGDPVTPLLRAYAGDDVVIRTLGIGERAEALRMQGHRFRMERFNPDGQLMDTAVTGISERFDYILDGGAGGPESMPGDYLYHSARTFALEGGAWGIFRVHDTQQSNLRPLPDNSPPAGAGFPAQEAHDAANPQVSPGPEPAGPAAATTSEQPCPGLGQRPLLYSVTAFNHELPSSPFRDTQGVVFALTSDVPAIQNGDKELEPLVLRANQGDCVVIQLRNRLNPDPDPAEGSLYSGPRAGIDLGMLVRNPQLAGGSAVGLNPDTTVAAGEDIEYRFLADVQGTAVFRNLGSPASMRHGAYGMLIVEPPGSRWFDSTTGAELSNISTSTSAIIDAPGQEPFREFALAMHTTDQQYSRSIVRYIDVVAGNGINAPRGANVPGPGSPGAPPGTTDVGSHDKAYNHINYRTEPLTERIGLTEGPGQINDDTPWWDPDFEVAAPYGTAFSSGAHGDPDTPVLGAHAGDRVVIRMAAPASDQLHSFTIGGHMFPLEPDMWDDESDHRSQLMSARTITTGQVVNAWLVGGAGGPAGNTGDYVYQDSRQPWTLSGVWGILRVLPAGTGGIAPLP